MTASVEPAQLEAIVNSAVESLGQQLGEAREELGRVKAWHYTVHAELGAKDREIADLRRRLEAAERERQAAGELLAAAQEQIMLLVDSKAYGQERPIPRSREEARPRRWSRPRLPDRSFLMWLAGMAVILAVAIVFHPDANLLLVLVVINLLVSVALREHGAPTGDEVERNSIHARAAAIMSSATIRRWTKR